MKKTCDCHLKLKECKSPIYINRTSIWRKPSELLKCGKVKKLIKELMKNEKLPNSN